MKQEQQLLYKVMRNFEGMQKIEVLDVLFQIEMILYDTKSPIEIKEIKNILVAPRDSGHYQNPSEFTILPNGNFCELEGANNWIHIYREVKRGFRKYNPIPRYYFKTKYAPLEILKLTKKNLMENVHNSQHEKPVAIFLAANSITKKDPATSKMLLLKVDY